MDHISSISDRMFNTENELDLSRELKEFFSGKDFGMKKGLVFILRKLRRNHDNSIVKCSCSNKLDNRGSRDCPYCDSIGALWDEEVGKMYLYNKRYISFTSSFQYDEKNMRNLNEQYIFLSESKYNLKEGDYIIEMKKTTDGNFEVPLIRETYFYVTSSRELGMVNNKEEMSIIVAEIMAKNSLVQGSKK